MKDKEMDEDALLKYADQVVKEVHWKPVVKTSIEKCCNEIMAKKDDIVKELEKVSLNIKKDQCNSIFMTFIACVYAADFVVRKSKFSNKFN